MKDQLPTLLALAQDSARRAGDLLVERLNTDFKICKKGRINLVTEIDLQSEALIVGGLREHFPDHQILTEEQASRQTDSPFKWIIDPLDGTTNYAHGYPFFCVSIALELAGEIVLGVVYDPIADEMFSALKGGGATLNGQAIRVSAEPHLSESLLCTSFSYQQADIRVNLRHFNPLILEARAIRRDGAAALDLCYVGCGRFDGFWGISLNAWDVAAGLLINEEAGGRGSRFDGSPTTIYDREILATNGRIHGSMMALLESDNHSRIGLWK